MTHQTASLAPEHRLSKDMINPSLKHRRRLSILRLSQFWQYYFVNKGIIQLHQLSDKALDAGKYL